MMLTTLFALAMTQTAPLKITVDVSKPTTLVSPSLYGIFFEEINQAGDGGIYAELLRNRGFESTSGNGLPVGWSSIGGASVDTANGLNAAHPASIKVSSGGEVTNEGFWGVPLKTGEKYKLVVWAKGPGKLSAEFATTGTSWPAALGTPGSEWKRYEKTLVAKSDDAKGKLTFRAENGELWIGFASLMPATWKNRPNGLRKDLAHAVDAMKPAFVRFPGGCYVEGGDKFADAFDWRRSVGPIEERKGLAHSMWGYSNTFGLGYHEYLQWCEDMNSAPLFVVNAGINHRQITPIPEMGKWVSEALDAIEYANGPVTSKWGAVRAKNGHPKPFGLKYVEIGNENGGWFFGGNDAYAPRYRILFDAIKKAYPEIITISNTVIPHPIEVVDEHYYEDPGFFWRNSSRYDTYDRKGPKVYVGEYAVTKGSGTGNLDAALGEAAFMVGMERNSDIVTMSSYAPLFVNVNNRQWNPNAIVFNNEQQYGTPSYHVQSIFANNRPDQNVAIEFPSFEGKAPQPGGGVGLMTWRTQAEYKDIEIKVDGKTVYTSKGLNASALNIKGGKWSVTDGVARQDEIADNRMALIKDARISGASKYTLHLKARKLSGDEGFIIIADENDGSWMDWNLGGWNNRETAFQRNGAVIGRSIPHKIETNRWYDIRIERDGSTSRGYLDGKLLQEVTEKGSTNFTSTAGIDRKKKELVIKVVNGANEARTTVLDLKGVNLRKVGKCIVMSGPNLMGENSFASPKAIAPRQMPVNNLAANMKWTFEPYSVTVLRLPIR